MSSLRLSPKQPGAHVTGCDGAPPPSATRSWSPGRVVLVQKRIAAPPPGAGHAPERAILPLRSTATNGAPALGQHPDGGCAPSERARRAATGTMSDQLPVSGHELSVS
jgi:hypothetical protein